MSDEVVVVVNAMTIIGAVVDDEVYLINEVVSTV